MTGLRKLFPPKHPTHKRFASSRRSALCGTVLVASLLVASHGGAEAFSQKAVDLFLDTQKCVRCDLRAAHLAGNDLRSFKLMGAYLIGAKLTGANLSGADLRGGWLICAKLRRATLEGANLFGTRLVGADLTNANLRKIDLQHAQLGRAILTGTNLKGANLLRANLQETKLNKVRHLVQRQVDKACSNAETVLPPGLSIPFCPHSAK